MSVSLTLRKLKERWVSNDKKQIKELSARGAKEDYHEGKNI